MNNLPNLSNYPIDVIAELLTNLLLGTYIKKEEAAEPICSALQDEVLSLVVRSKAVDKTLALSLLDSLGEHILLRVLAESDIETLVNTNCINEELSVRLCKAVSYIAWDMCVLYEIEMSQQDAIPTRVFIQEDKEIEREWHVGGLVPDENGWPVWTDEVIVNDGIDINTPYFLFTAQQVECKGYSGLMPYEYVPTTEPHSLVEGPDAVTDYKRSAAGFLSNELTGSNQLDKTVNDIVWKFRKDSKKKRNKRFSEWKAWIRRNPTKLVMGRKTFWKQYFDRKEHKKLDTWLTHRQISDIKELFESSYQVIRYNQVIK